MLGRFCSKLSFCVHIVQFPKKTYFIAVFQSSKQEAIKEGLEASKYEYFVLNVAAEAPANDVTEFFNLIRAQLVLTANRTIVLSSFPFELRNFDIIRKWVGI